MSDLLPVLQRIAGGQRATTDLFKPGLTVTVESDPVTNDDLVKVTQSSGENFLTLGQWRLRFPRDHTVANPGSPKAPLLALLRIKATGTTPNGKFELSLSGVELVSDPDQVCAARLVESPYTHLVEVHGRTGFRQPVVFRGPGARLDLDLSPGAPAWPANAALRPLDGTTPSRFVPLLRADPPHALVGIGTIGLTCEAVELFLDGTSAPPGQAAPWHGLFLPQLGLYINNEGAPDTWSGMTQLRNFALSLSPAEVSGAFAAEIVHHVVFKPQIRVTLHWVDNPLTGTEKSVTDVGDFTVPTPHAGYRYRRVRPVVELNWDQHPEHSEHYTSGGYRVRWTPPVGGHVEFPLQLDDDDLGWVRLPPGKHTFTVEVGDYRVGVKTHTFRITVDGAPQPLRLLLEAAPQIPGNLATEGPRYRLHAPLELGQQVFVTARLFSGFQGPAVVTLSAVAIGSGLPLRLPTGLQRTTTPPDRWDEQDVPPFWTIDIPAKAANLATEGVLVVDAAQDDANGSPVTTTRRLRYSLVPPAAPGAPDLRLEPRLDWQEDPGPGIAVLHLGGGVPVEDVVWELEWMPAGDDLFADPAQDNRFAAGFAFPSGESALAAVSAHAVSVHLHTSDQLWRLTARVPGRPGTTLPRPAIVVGELPNSARLGPEGAGLSDDTRAAAWAPNAGLGIAGQASLIVFPLDRSGLGETGEERLTGDLVVHRRSGADTLALQAGGLVMLLEAIYAHAGGIETIDLYGSASSEGEAPHNQKLGAGRAEAVRGFLSTAMASGPAAAFAAANLSVPTGVSFPTDYATVTGALTGVLRPHGIGALGASVPLPNVDADDRRVFALLRLVAAPSAALQGHCYFATLSGQPPLAYGLPVRLPARRDHPLQHRWFRQARLDVELLRNRLVRAQIAVTVDVKAFKDNQDIAVNTPLPPINTHDGVMSFVLGYREIPGPAGSPSRFRWQAELVADPADIDGLALLAPAAGASDLEGGVRALAGSAIFLPAVIALQGGTSSALAAAAGAAGGALLTTTQPAVINPRRMVWRGGRAAVGYVRGGVPSLRIGVDYEVQYAVNVDLAKALGLPIEIKLRTTKPVLMTFRNLGINLTPGLAPTFDYTPSDGFSLQINDPGLFDLGDNPLGRVLQVQSVRLSAGSPLSLETEIRFAFETGFFEIDGVRIRAALDMAKLFTGGPVVMTDIDVEITKIGARANIPGVLAGGGSIELGNPVGGYFDLNLVPVKVRVFGGFRMYDLPDFRALYVGIGAEFSPGILLGASGVAIKGLEGLVGVNINREATDPRRVLEWYRKPQAGAIDPSKWTPRRGGFAFGIGAVLGTAADGGFVWSIKGTLIIELPGPRIVLAARSRFLVTEDDRPKASDNSNVALEGGVLTAILLDFEAGIFAAQTELELSRPKIFSVTFPVDIFFDVQHPEQCYLRFGQYAPAGGKLIEAKVFDFLQVWSYIQVEGNGFHSDKLNLEGLCVAHGSHAGFLYGAKPVAWFEAWLEYHVGLQMRPLYLEGVIEIGGMIGILTITVGATATLTVKAPEPWYLHVKACAQVRILWWTVEGCAEMGPYISGSPAMPPPEVPLRQVSVADRPIRVPLPLTDVPIDAVLRLEFDKVVWAEEDPTITRFGNTPRRNQATEEVSYEFDLLDLRLTNTADPADTRSGAALWGGFVPSNLAKSPMPPVLQLMSWPEPSVPPQDTLELSTAERQTLTTLVTELCTTPPPTRLRAALIDGLPLGAAARWKLIRDDLLPTEVLAPGTGGLGTYWGSGAPGAALATVAQVVPLPSVDYQDRRAKQRALQLPAAPAGRLSPDLAAVVATLLKLPTDRIPGPDGQLLPDEVDPVVATGARVIQALWLQAGDRPGDTVAVARVSQLVIVTLADVVAAEAVVLLAPGAAGGGAIWLDGAGTVLDIQTGLEQQPVLPGSTGTGSYTGWTAHGARFSSPLAPSAAKRARTLVVLGPPSTPAYLTEVRALTYGDWRAAQAEGARRRDTVTTLATQTGLFADPPTVSNRPLLAPSATYRIDGTVAWRRYRKALPDGSGKIDLASATGGPPRTLTTSSTPPADLSPYVRLVEPAGERVPLYLSEALRITFINDTIDALYARFRQRLVVRAKASRSGAAVISYTANVTQRVFVPIGAWEETIAAATDQAPCLGSTIPAKSQISLTGLQPNSPYTLSIVGQDVVIDGRGNDITPLPTDDWIESVIVAPGKGSLFRLNFRTSRFTGFVQHVQRYLTDEQDRPQPALDLVAGSAQQLATALVGLGTGAMVRDDQAVDTVCQALVGGPIELPRRCEVTRLWTVATDGGTPTLSFAGLLLDGPEPLLRLREDGSAQVVMTPPAVWRVVTGASGARVFLFAPTTAPTGPGPSTVTVAFTYRRSAQQPPPEPEEKASIAVPVPVHPPSE